MGGINAIPYVAAPFGRPSGLQRSALHSDGSQHASAAVLRLGSRAVTGGAQVQLVFRDISWHRCRCSNVGIHDEDGWLPWWRRAGSV
jgi:hypothetical protein